MTSKDITLRMFTYLYDKYYPIIPNCYIYYWESDILAINKITNFISEYEIKISRADYKNDFKKSLKHKAIGDAFNLKCNFDSVPNYFYYVTTPGLIDKSELPEYAGLIEVGVFKPRIVKRAPMLHNKIVIAEMEIKLLKKLYYKYWKVLGQNIKEDK